MLLSDISKIVECKKILCKPIFLNSFSKVSFELDFTAKHIIGLIFLNKLLNLKKLFLNCASE